MASSNRRKLESMISSLKEDITQVISKLDDIQRELNNSKDQFDDSEPSSPTPSKEKFYSSSEESTISSEKQPDEKAPLPAPKSLFDLIDAENWKEFHNLFDKDLITTDDLGKIISLTYDGNNINLTLIEALITKIPNGSYSIVEKILQKKLVKPEYFLRQYDAKYNILGGLIATCKKDIAFQKILHLLIDDKLITPEVILYPSHLRPIIFYFDSNKITANLRSKFYMYCSQSLQDSDYETAKKWLTVLAPKCSFEQMKFYIELILKKATNPEFKDKFHFVMQHLEFLSEEFRFAARTYVSAFIKDELAIANSLVKCLEIQAIVANHTYLKSLFQDDSLTSFFSDPWNAFLGEINLIIQKAKNEFDDVNVSQSKSVDNSTLTTSLLNN